MQPLEPALHGPASNPKRKLLYSRPTKQIELVRLLTIGLNR